MNFINVFISEWIELKDELQNYVYKFHTFLMQSQNVALLCIHNLSLIGYILPVKML